MKTKKSKRAASLDAPVDPQVVETAKKFVFEAEPPRTYPCRVCSEPGATDDSEGLCWVCRRLKISAWREQEQQIPLAE